MPLAYDPVGVTVLLGMPARAIASQAGVYSQVAEGLARRTYLVDDLSVMLQMPSALRHSTPLPLIELYSTFPPVYKTEGAGGTDDEYSGPRIFPPPFRLGP